MITHLVSWQKNVMNWRIYNNDQINDYHWCPYLALSHWLWFFASLFPSASIFTLPLFCFIVCIDIILFSLILNSTLNVALVSYYFINLVVSHFASYNHHSHQNFSSICDCVVIFDKFCKYNWAKISWNNSIICIVSTSKFLTVWKILFVPIQYTAEEIIQRCWCCSNIHALCHSHLGSVSFVMKISQFMAYGNRCKDWMRR